MSVSDEDKVKRFDQLVAVIEKTYHSPGNLMWRSLLVGLLSGLGATFGVAIVLALLGFMLRELGGLPVIGDWLNDVSRILPGRR